MRITIKKIDDKYLIDWDRHQLVICADRTIILTNGVHTCGDFTGTVLSSDIYKVGQIDNDWAKKNFVPFHGEITLSNE